MLFEKLRIILAVGLALGVISTQAEADFSVVSNPFGGSAQEASLTGVVLQNSYPAPFGDEYRTWTLVLRTADGREIVAEEKGFNPLPMVKAHYLADIAREAGEEVRVTGKVKTGTADRTTLMLDSIEYQAYRINTDEGPFTPYFYSDCYPGTPLFYGGHTFYPGEMPF